MQTSTHMLREVGEAAAAVARMRAANADAIRALAPRIIALDPKVVVTIARGSSDHCALYLKYLVEIGLGIPCASLGPSIASLYDAPLRLAGALAISWSQSGRSPDIVAMQRAAKRAGALTLAFVNDEASPLAAEPDCLLPLHAGPERSVAATKSMIAGLVAGADLVAAWRGDAAMAVALADLPTKLAAQIAPPPAALVDLVTSAKSTFVLGRGATFAIAAEAALKLKETCAIHAEAFSSAEVLHGPAGIVTPGFLVIAFVPQDEARDGMIATLDRFREMGARVLAIDAAAADGPDLLAAADAGHPRLTPITMIHRFYFLAEASARRLGRDPDNPENLRKITETR
jgi:glucosamine--fructose-6-phosphate aminotransferase (isomerizing)